MCLGGMTRLNRARQAVKAGFFMTVTKTFLRAGLLHQWFYKRVQKHVGYAVVTTATRRATLALAGTQDRRTAGNA